jgi:hypothetical protein
VLGVEGTVPAKRFLEFLRILPKCSVKAFLVGGGPKESARNVSVGLNQERKSSIDEEEVVTI